MSGHFPPCGTLHDAGVQTSNTPTADPQERVKLPPDYEPRLTPEKGFKDFLDEKEMLTRLPISRRTLQNWRQANKIPSIKIGRRVLFCWDNVAAALRRLERGGIEQQTENQFQRHAES